MESCPKYRLVSLTAALMPWIIAGCSKLAPPATSPPSNPPAPITTNAPKTDSKAAAKLRQLGLQYRQQERYTEAISALEKAVSLDSENLSGIVLLGWTLHLGGRENAAAEALQQALDKDANYVPALNALGIVYLVSGNLSAAVATHERARELKADNEIAYYNLALAYHRLEQYNLALSRAKQATTLEPQNPHPWVALALIYWQQGDKTQAKQTYNKAIQLDSRYRQSGFLDELKQAGFSQQQIEGVRKILEQRNT